eukprot:jgi/Mesvir1/14158/Mv08929-RA.1
MASSCSLLASLPGMAALKKVSNQRLPGRARCGQPPRRRTRRAVVMSVSEPLLPRPTKFARSTHLTTKVSLTDIDIVPLIDLAEGLAEVVAYVPAVEVKDVANLEALYAIEPDISLTLAVLEEAAVSDTFMDASGQASSLPSWLVALLPSWVTSLTVSDHVKGILLLNIMTALLGSNIAVVKAVQEEGTLDPALFLAGRFLVAAAAFSPSFRDVIGNNVAIAAGVELGVWSTLAYVTQSLALMSSDASSVSFLSTLTVITVPLLATLCGSRLPRGTWPACCLALFGIYLLEVGSGAAGDGAASLSAAASVSAVAELASSAPSSLGDVAGSLSPWSWLLSNPARVGDAWAILSALVFAVQLLRVEHFSHHSLKSADTRPMLAVQLVTVAAASCALVAYKHCTGTLELPPRAAEWLAQLAAGGAPAGAPSMAEITAAGMAAMVAGTGSDMMASGGNDGASLASMGGSIGVGQDAAVQGLIQWLRPQAWADLGELAQSLGVVPILYTGLISTALMLWCEVRGGLSSAGFSLMLRIGEWEDGGVGVGSAMSPGGNHPVARFGTKGERWACAFGVLLQVASFPPCLFPSAFFPPAVALHWVKASEAALIYAHNPSLGLLVPTQTMALRWVNASEAALIYALDPVWGAGMAYVFLGERWGTLGWWGAALIIGASILPQLFRNDDDEVESTA